MEKFEYSSQIILTFFYNDLILLSEKDKLGYRYVITDLEVHDENDFKGKLNTVLLGTYPVYITKDTGKIHHIKECGGSSSADEYFVAVETVYISDHPNTFFQKIKRRWRLIKMRLRF